MRNGDVRAAIARARVRTATILAFGCVCLLTVPNVYAVLPLLALGGRGAAVQALALPAVLGLAMMRGWTDPLVVIACFTPLFWLAIDPHEDRSVWPLLFDLVTQAAPGLGVAASVVIVAWPLVLEGDLGGAMGSDVEHLAYCADLLRGAAIYDVSRWPPGVSCGYHPLVYVPFGLAPVGLTVAVGKVLSVASLWSLSWSLGRGRWSPTPFLCAPALLCARVDNPTLWLVAILAAVGGRR